MKYIIILILFIESVHAQSPYNHRLENGQVQALRKLIYELDESYLTIGRGIATIDYRCGVYATEIDKETGEILANDKYTERGKFFFFGRGNSILGVHIN